MECKFFFFKGMDVFENLLNIVLENVLERVIVKGWDELFWLIVFICMGCVLVKIVLEWFGSVV